MKYPLIVLEGLLFKYVQGLLALFCRPSTPPARPWPPALLSYIVPQLLPLRLSGPLGPRAPLESGWGCELASQLEQEGARLSSKAPAGLLFLRASVRQIYPSEFPGQIVSILALQMSKAAA